MNQYVKMFTKCVTLSHARVDMGQCVSGSAIPEVEQRSSSRRTAPRITRKPVSLDHAVDEIELGLH